MPLSFEDRIKKQGGATSANPNTGAKGTGLSFEDRIVNPNQQGSTVPSASVTPSSGVTPVQPTTANKPSITNTATYSELISKLNGSQPKFGVIKAPAMKKLSTNFNIYNYANNNFEDPVLARMVGDGAIRIYEGGKGNLSAEDAFNAAYNIFENSGGIYGASYGIDVTKERAAENTLRNFNEQIDNAVQIAPYMNMSSEQLQDEFAKIQGQYEGRYKYPNEVGPTISYAGEPDNMVREWMIKQGLDRAEKYINSDYAGYVGYMDQQWYNDNVNGNLVRSLFEDETGPLNPEAFVSNGRTTYKDDEVRVYSMMLYGRADELEAEGKTEAAEFLRNIADDVYQDDGAIFYGYDNESKIERLTLANAYLYGEDLPDLYDLDYKDRWIADQVASQNADANDWLHDYYGNKYDTVNARKYELQSWGLRKAEEYRGNNPEYENADIIDVTGEETNNVFYGDYESYDREFGNQWWLLDQNMEGIVDEKGNLNERARNIFMLTNASNDYLALGWAWKNGVITDDEKKMYSYLVSSGKTDEAKQYYDDVLKYKCHEFMDMTIQSAKTNANWAQKAVNFLGSTFQSVFGSIPYTISMFIQNAERADTGRPPDYYASLMETENQALRSRQAVYDSVDWNVNIFGRQVDLFDFLMSTGASTMDSLLAAFVGRGVGKVFGSGTKVAQFVSSALIGSSAGANYVYEAVKSGNYNDAQILAGFMGAMINETLWESVSIGKFFEGTKTVEDVIIKDRAGWRKVINTAFKTSGIDILTNASEETITEIANITFDYWVGGDNSEYAIAYRFYTNELGMTDEEARGCIAKEIFWRCADAGIGGGFQGFGMGAAGSANVIARNYDVIQANGFGQKTAAVDAGYYSGKASGMSNEEAIQNARIKVVEEWCEQKGIKLSSELLEELNDPAFRVDENTELGQFAHNVLMNDNTGEMTGLREFAKLSPRGRLTIDNLMRIAGERATAESKVYGKTDESNAKIEKYAGLSTDANAYGEALAADAEATGAAAGTTVPSETTVKPEETKAPATARTAEEENTMNASAAEKAGVAQDELLDQQLAGKTQKEKDQAYIVLAQQEAAKNGAHYEADMSKYDWANSNAENSAADAGNTNASANNGPVTAETYSEMLDEAEAEDNAAPVLEDNPAELRTPAERTAQGTTETAEKHPQTFNKKADPNAAGRGAGTLVNPEAEQKEGNGATYTATDEGLVDRTAEENPVTLDEASEKYGDQKGVFTENYNEGQSVSEYDTAFSAAFNAGKTMLPYEVLNSSDTASYLTAKQKMAAYEAGRKAREAADSAAEKKHVKPTGGTARKIGTVRFVGGDVSSLNSQQKAVTRYARYYAEATGTNVVFYASEVGEDGKYHGTPPIENGRDAQGAFVKETPDTVYIDLNAGLTTAKDNTDLPKYALGRTLGHEIYHQLKYWNPTEAADLERIVFSILQEKGENVLDLVESVMDKGFSAEYASEDVVAEALADILPSTGFVQKIADENRNLFQKIYDRIKEFVGNIRDYFSKLAPGRMSASEKLKIEGTIDYLQSIVDKYDQFAKKAVENMQLSFAGFEDTNTAENVGTQAENVNAEETKPETVGETATETVYETEGESETQEPEAVNQPKTEQQNNENKGYTVSDSDVRNGYVEVRFAEKPSQDVIDALKQKKFRWNGKKGVWYGAGDVAGITDYIGNASNTGTAQNDTQNEAREPVQKENAQPAENKVENTQNTAEETTEQAENVKQEPDQEKPVKATTKKADAKAKAANGFTQRALKHVLSLKKTDTAVFYWTRINGEDKYFIGQGFFLANVDKETYDETIEKLRYKGTAKVDQRSTIANLDNWLSDPAIEKISGPAYVVNKDSKNMIVVKANLGMLIIDEKFARIFDGLDFYRTSDKKKFDSHFPVIVKDANGNAVGLIMPIRSDGITAKSLENSEVSKLVSFSTPADNNTEESVKQKEETEKPKEAKSGIKATTPSAKTAERILTDYLRAGKKMTSQDLYAICDDTFGGSQAEGKYDRKDAYDAMELAVNKYLVEIMRGYNTGTVENALEGLQKMQGILELLPTQNVRTDEQEKFQQFSTPPNIAYLTAWVANVSGNDHVMEPSAGIGGLASFAKAWGAEVTVNELSKRRLEVLREMGFEHMFNENAEHINNILPDSIQPTVVIMNPPFSATGGRLATNKTSNAEAHINSALSRLADGGRLVAIVGRGMNNSSYGKYWNKLRENYNIRANISIDGENYKKYGTTFDVQIVVIDKTGPQGNNITVTGEYSDLSQVPGVLEGIRNDRKGIEGSRTASSRNGMDQSSSDGGNRLSGNGYVGSSERDSGNASVNRPESDRKGNKGDGGNRGVSDSKGSAQAGSKKAESKNGTSDRNDGREDTGRSNTTDRSDRTDRPESELSLPRLKEEVSDDGVYASYVAPDIPVKGSGRHPAVLVESAAMASTPMPKATYRPSLPDNVARKNLSDAQMVSVTYAGQSHEQKLPDGKRKGFFIGDGTGVGKGRQISGIILDNFMQGRKKAVWISEKKSLYVDAGRDWSQTTGRDKNEVFNISKTKPNAKISENSGILFSTYDTLKMNKGGSRIDQIVDWLGEDFDGVIVFDEAHNMGNLNGKQGKRGPTDGSAKAKAGVELQQRLPNARVVYASATAATEVENLAYAERLGLWGKGTAFNDAKDFISKIGSAGLAAMELVVRDMKAMGVYVARSISYNGVNYNTVEHTLDPMQTEIYNTMSRAWQKVMQNVQNALQITGGSNNSLAKQRAIGQFYGSIQRFYNQVLTSMSMPSVIADMRKELSDGHSVVLQIVNTNEAQQEKALGKAKEEGAEDLENLDLTPREQLIGYLENSFPTQLYEEYIDDNGNVQSRPVVDSNGQPVQDKEAIRMRDGLIEEVRKMSIPDGPLEMLFDAFGTENVAEITGRRRRVVPKKQADGSVKRVEEARSPVHREADVQAFQDGKKHILIFSDAGGTGKSYHADLSAKNQELRVHYVLQPGWEAAKAVQGFGRTHRSNEKQPPVYKLVTTNIKGQKRFTSTIARRLDQLGALTKGQRDTGSGMFGAKDNLETDLARDSLRAFYDRLGKNQIEDINGMEMIDRLGLKGKFTDQFGNFKLNEDVSRDISLFLNRILALEVDDQNTLFDEFINIYETQLEAAIQAGTLDTGMENVKADKVEILDDKVIREDTNTGSSTHYIQAKTYTKPKVVTTVAEMQKKRAGFVGIYRTDSGNVRAVYRVADKTTAWGAIQKQYRLVGPNMGASTNTWSEGTLESKAKLIEKAEWQSAWDEEVKKVPEYNEDTLHMLSGALLPIWNNLPQEGNTKVKRLIASDGSMHLGRVITKDMIDSVLKQFSVARTLETYTPQQVMDNALKKGERFYLTNSRAQIFRSRVSGEWRLEISQNNDWYLTKQYPGIIHEKISFKDRYFIPTGENGVGILQKIVSDNPIARTTVVDEDNLYQLRDSEYDEEERVMYQLRPVDPVEPTTQGWQRTKTTDEAKSIYPNLWNVAAEESETRNPTQVASTVGTYRKIYDILKAEGFNGKILDASSGMGIGTQTGRNEYGFDVEDIEPYHGTGYIPMYTDYSSLGKKYDVIISSAVLNVLPQDQRDALVVKMGEMLNPGGRMFITTRGKDVEQLANTGKNIHLGNMEWIETVKGSYQKGFTNPELIMYLRDALGDNFSVVPASKETGGKFNNNTNVVVTKVSEETKYQERTTPLSDREVLMIAANELYVNDTNANTRTLSEAEASALRIFKERVDKLNELSEKRLEEGRKYKEQQFGKNVDREEAQKTLNRMHVLDEQIKKANNDVLSVENKELLRKVLSQARKVVENNERQRGKEALARYRNRIRNTQAINKYKERIQRDTDRLKKWITHPDNKSAIKHVPDVLKNSVIQFLTSIDFTSKRSLNGGAYTKADARFMEGIRNVRQAIKENIDVEGLYSGYADLPAGFMDELDAFINAAQALADAREGDYIINRMTSEELKLLSKAVKVLTSLITKMNSFHQNAMFQHTYDAGDNSIEFMSGLSNGKKTNRFSDWLLWKTIRPEYAFERFGEGGKSIFDEFRRGQSKMAFNTVAVQKFVNETYTAKEVEAWEKEIHTFDIGGDTVQIPATYLMGLYELMKREQARKHILGEGIRVATYKLKGQKKQTDVGHALSLEMISKMVSELTPRQKEVADKLQKYMAVEGGKLGNYVSVARFGEEEFGENDYYPINSDGQHLKATADEKPSNASLYALLNMSFTKDLNEKANNRLILYSIFDVFSNHMGSMIQYNAFALPVLDALKWFNYRQTEENEDGRKVTLDSVRDQMARVYGKPVEDTPGGGSSGYAASFVTNIIKAFNGTETQGISSDVPFINVIHRYNVAQVAFNLRVVVQQPLAITRAGLLVDYRNIIKGLKASPSQIKANIEEMKQYSGIAAWKSLGFYDVNISRGLNDIIKNNKNTMEKIDEVGMKGAEFADTVTWAAMWNACKVQVKKETGMSYGDKEFFNEVVKLFEEVVYKTQVVDSVLTKNEFLRSKGGLSRLFGSFMSEPMTTASMVIDAFDKYNMDLKRGMSKREAWNNNKKNIGRTAYVYGISALLLAVVTAAMDALRDDDDYASFIEKYLNAFKGNLEDELNPMNKLPIMRDVYEISKSLLEKWGVDTYGNTQRSVFQWVDYLLKANDIIYDKITGEDTNYTWFGGIYKLLQAASGMSGVPISSATREVQTAWNFVVGSMAPSLKLKTYDAGARANIKYAYQDGYLTDEEAIDELIKSKEAKDENEAYFLVQNWKTGSTSNYFYVYEAMETGEGFDDAVADMVAHGYKFENVISQARSHITSMYKEDKIGYDEAVSMLVTYGGLMKDEATEKINEQRAKKEAGIAVSDIGDALMDGEISKDEAIQMWVEYTGMTRTEASEKAEAIDLQRQYPGWKANDAQLAISTYKQYGKGKISESSFIKYRYDMDQFSGKDADHDGKVDSNSVRTQRWNYINRLPISNEAKDALHLSYYKASTLDQAPWNK